MRSFIQNRKIFDELRPKHVQLTLEVRAFIILKL